MSNPKVSILISLYNVQKFLLEKELSDVRNQTYKNLEIILVDDGSTDSTLSICKQIASKDKRITIIHKENGGLGSARNTGLERATGKYIYFCDIDDTIHANLVERNVKVMEETKAEMIVFSFHVIYADNSSPEENVVFPNLDLASNEMIKKNFIEKLLLVRNGNGFVWNKFYSRDFIEQHHFRFKNHRIQQDELFNIQFYPKLTHLVLIPDVLYTYYIYNTGNNRSYYIPNRLEIYQDIFNSFKSQFKSWGILNSKTIDYINVRFWNGIKDSILFNTFHPEFHINNIDRKKHIISILSKPDVKKNLEYISKTHHLRFNDKRYLSAFSKQNVGLIIFWRCIFNCLSKIKKMIS